MVQRTIAIVLLTFLAHTKELAANNIANTQDSKEKLAVKLFNRALVAQALEHTDLEKIALKKCTGQRTLPVGAHGKTQEVIDEQMDKFKHHLAQSGENLRELLQDEMTGALQATEQALLDEARNPSMPSQREILQAKSASFLQALIAEQVDKFKDHLAQSGERLRELLQEEIADALKAETLNEGDKVITQGEPGDKFYIVEEGNLYATKDGTRVMDYKPGDYFGELALLKNQPRAASVVVESKNAKVLCMSRLSFNKMLGPLTDILQKNIVSYM